MSTLKADTVTRKTDNTDLTSTGQGSGVPNIDAGFKVGGTAGVPSASIQDDAVTLAKMAPGTDGVIISYDASGNPVHIGPGSDGEVLTSTGAGSPPAFEAVSAGGGGKILQVVTATSSTQTDISGTTWTDISGATGSITPASTSNKILIMMQATGTSHSTGNNIFTQLLRDSTAISAYGPYTIRPASGATGIWSAHYMHFMYIDSPSSTSSITYKAQGKMYESATLRINQSSTNGLCFSLLEIDGT